MLQTTLAGSLPKASWLADPEKLWPAWRLEGDALAAAKIDATVLAVKQQEDAGIDIVTNGEQARIHFVHGFLANLDGIDCSRREDDWHPRRPLLRRRPHGGRPDAAQALGPWRGSARHARPHQAQAEIHAAGSDDHRRHHRRRPLRQARRHGDGVRRAPQPGGPRTRGARRRRHSVRRARLQRLHGPVKEWGIAALHKAIEGLPCTTAVHICYGYGIEANIAWKKTLGQSWRRYEETFPR